MAAEHLYCPRCGARRRISSLQPRPPDQSHMRTRWLPYLFGAGALFWLVELTQFAAVVAAPAGRDQLVQALIAAGIRRDLSTVLVIECVIVLLFEAGAVALHACAFYGLRRFRPWGWVAALITSVAWSLVLLGIPVLVLLLQRPTREAYGIS